MKLKGPFSVKAHPRGWEEVCDGDGEILANARFIARALNDLEKIRLLARGDVDVRIVGGSDAVKLHKLIYPNTQRRKAK